MMEKTVLPDSSVIAKLNDEELVVYFHEKSKVLKPTSLWSIYSMLRVTIQLNQNIDISQYKRLKGILKVEGVGYIPKKSKIFTAEDITRFLQDAPDEKYLDLKVVCIFGTSGACRSDELTNIKHCDIKFKGDAFTVDIPKTKTNHPRRFHIHEKFTPIIQKYINLRPPACNIDRLFLNYVNQKCTNQPIGKNKFMKMPKLIAKFLQLPDADGYTGHSFRRNSATLLAESGADIAAIQRHGGWKSARVAEGYVDGSDILKKTTSHQISKNINLSTHKIMDAADASDAPQITVTKPDLEPLQKPTSTDMNQNYHFHNCTVYFQPR